MPRAAKKRPGRPYLTIKDIPDIFFTYYDAYRYGFLDKMDFAFILQISKFRVEHYLRIIEAKAPIVSCEENKERRMELGLQKNDCIGMSKLYCTLKKEHGEYVNENKTYIRALSGQMRWERLKKEEACLKRAKEDTLPNEKND